MNTSVEGIIVNNCQYAPIYILQDPGATQANTYVLTPSNIEPPKTVTNNLKTFYENSGNIENGLLNTDTVARQNAIKKKEGVLIGNNLKLASFLLPKNDNVNKQYVVDNIVLKPAITSAAPVSTPVPPVPVITHTVNNPVSTVNTVPKLDIDRKIVKLKEVPIIRNRPKIKPKENTPSPTQSKYTSVQLIKLGETYHSLNHLSEEQIKMVNQALKMFNDRDKSAPEPTYDPVTNTKYIYKVVSPKDLTVVAKKKVLLKDKKPPPKIVKKVEEKIAKPTVSKEYVKTTIPKEVPVQKEVIEEDVPPEAKVTRSGRKVKLPKQILPEDSPQKYKKKCGTIVTCFQCSTDFGSLYRLQKHYENHPTHIPAKVHSNLFHCLLAIIKSGSEEDKTNIFIQQLEQFLVKLKSLLPCLLKKVDGTEGQPCTINDDIGRLFGMNPGKYNIDVDALNCVKDKNGYCIHNPQPKPKLEQSKQNQHLLKNATAVSPESESENCARINSVAKWPTVSKRIWKLKQKNNELSAKKMRLKSESDTLIDLGTEDLIFSNDNEINVTSDNNVNIAGMISEENNVTKLLDNTQECKSTCQSVPETQPNNVIMGEPSKPTNNYVQFHSAHFDIRSSPIKPSSAVFRKFQINPSKMSNYDVQVIRSLQMVNKGQEKSATQTSDDLHVSLANTDNSLHLSNTDNMQQVPSAHNSLHVTLPITENGQHMTIPNPNNRLHASLSNSDNRLHVGIQNSDRLHVNMAHIDNDLHVQKSSLNTSLHVDMSSSNGGLHLTSMSNGLHEVPSTSNGLHVNLPDTDNGLHIPTTSSLNLSIHMTNSNDNLSLPSTDSLHDLFKDDVDLSCKETDTIDPDLKDWIISTSEKSQDSFTKSNSLIEPALLHVRDSNDKLDSHKSVSHNGDMPSLDSSDSRLLSSQGESVLNFLDTLGNDLYPETEIRNNGVDFQLDLFTFHNT